MTNCWCWWLSISSWIDSVIDWVWLELWVWSELTGIKEHGVTILKFEANDRGEGTVDVDNAAFEQSLSFSFLLGVGVDNLKTSLFLFLLPSELIRFNFAVKY